jgi:hypothetical protein
MPAVEEVSTIEPDFCAFIRGPTDFIKPFRRYGRQYIRGCQVLERSFSNGLKLIG